VGEVQRELVVGPPPRGSLLHGALDIDDQIAAVSFPFAGHGIVAEADHIGGTVFTEILTVRLRDTFIVNQDGADFAPSVRCCFFLEPVPEPVSQLLQPGLVYRMFCLLV